MCLDKIEELLKEPGITEAYALELKTIAARADDFSVEVPTLMFYFLLYLNFSLLGTR